MNDTVSTWVIGAMTGVFGLLALIFAARAVDAAAMWFGLAGFVGAVLFGFWLMKRAFDEAERGG